jgi:hypothetical protein
MKKSEAPDAVVDRVYQAKLIEKFRETRDELGERAEIIVPNPLEGEPPATKLDGRFANVALRAANDLERTDYRRSHMLLIARMPAFLEATRVLQSNSNNTLKAMSNIQQSKLAIRSIANNLPRMNRRTFRQIAYESAYMFESDTQLINQTVKDADENMWSIIHKLGIEAALARIGRSPIDENPARRNHPGVILSPGTKRIKQLGESQDGQEMVIDIWTTEERAERSARQRGVSRIPRNEVVFGTNWTSADVVPDNPLRIADFAVEGVLERLEDAIDARAA